MRALFGALETGLESLAATGLGVAELWATMVQPEQPLLPRGGQYEIDPANAAMVKAREDIRRWRIDTPASYWQGIRRRFDRSLFSGHRSLRPVD